MHILYAVHGYKPAYRIGGPIISVSAKAEMLVKKGHKVTVFTTNSNLDEDLDVPTDQAVNVNGVDVWYFKRDTPLKKWLPFIPYVSKSMGYLYAPRMRSALDELVPNVDVVHTHLPFIYPTYAAAWAAFKYGKPLFYHQRGVFDPERLKYRSLKKRIFLDFIEKPILRRATALISLTEFETESYRMLGIDTHCEVIPNGINVNKYWQELPSEWNGILGIAPEVPVILFMSRLHPIKGAERLIDAFLKVLNDFPEAVLVMAGPDEHGLQKRMRQQLKGKKRAENILFPGMISGEMKTALLARADLFCLPSDAEGFPMAVLEALASRTAVLISPGCHFAEVEAANAGKIVSLAPEDIAEAITKLIANRRHLADMGANGVEFVRRHYNWEYIVDRLIALYTTASAKRTVE
jgi:glycosyltransferase involved in cell wall biosynthesis